MPFGRAATFVTNGGRDRDRAESVLRNTEPQRLAPTRVLIKEQQLQRETKKKMAGGIIHTSS